MSPFQRGIKGVKGPGLALGFNTFYFMAWLISLSKNWLKVRPAALADFGTKEVAVMPGIVFISKK